MYCIECDTSFTCSEIRCIDQPVLVYQEKREDVDWLFRCLLTSLKEAMHNAGPLFAFVPEFYVEACISAYSALKSYFTTSLLSPQSPGVLFAHMIPVTVGV